MTCANVGPANPDISGIGIITSFAVQGALSILLALYSNKLATNELIPLSHGILRHVFVFFGEDTILARVWLSYESLNRELDGYLHVKPRNKELALSIIEEILQSINDAQTLNGIALLIAALIQRSTLTLYHKHIVYDAVNFTGVSFCAALASLHRSSKARTMTQLAAIIVFSFLYLAFTIEFGIALGRWDSKISGHCYITKGISHPGDPHPLVDQVYLGITSFYLFVSLIDAILVHSLTLRSDTRKDDLVVLKGLHMLIRNVSPRQAFSKDQLQSPQARMQNILARNIHSVAMLQYPLHIYMLIALRVSNSDSLSGDSENTWGFGQIVALVSLGSIILECIRGISEYFSIDDIPDSLASENLQTEPGAAENGVVGEDQFPENHLIQRRGQRRRSF